RLSLAASSAARCRRSSPAHGLLLPTRRSVRFSANGPALRPGSGLSFCRHSRRSRPPASLPPFSSSAHSRSPSTHSSPSPNGSSSPGSRRPTPVPSRHAFTGAALAGFALVSAALAGSTQKLTLTLDWTPNPDHVGFYDARDTGLFARAGLDVTIRAPSDPTAPLKLVGVGKSDLAVSYEPELFFAAAKKLPVVAVAPVVPQPLNPFTPTGPHNPPPPPPPPPPTR